MYPDTSPAPVFASLPEDFRLNHRLRGMFRRQIEPRPRGGWPTVGLAPNAFLPQITGLVQLGAD